MIKIINTNNIKLPEAQQTWRKATCSGLVDKLNINHACNTSQSDVNAIADAMDQEMPQENMSQENMPQENMLFQPSKEEIAQLMIKQYIQQNGGIINKEENKINKPNKQILLG